MGFAAQGQTIDSPNLEVRASQELANALLKYDIIEPFQDGLALVVKSSDEENYGMIMNGKYGYINLYGEEVIPCNIIYYAYELHPDFSEGLAAIRIGDDCGYINTRGELVIPAIYGDACPFSDGAALVYKEGDGFFYIDKYGEKIVDCPIEFPVAADAAGVSYYDFKDGLLEGCGIGGKVGIMNKNGEFIVPVKYDAVGSFSDGLAKVELNGKSGFVNMTGNVVIPLKYEEGGYFSEGLGFVKTDGKWGFIDKNGNIAIPFKYNEVGGFHNGLAPVNYNGKWGYIDKKGNVVISYQFDSVRPFKNGYAIVENNNKYGVINKSGQYVIPNNYNSVYDDTDTFLILSNEKGDHLFSTDGQKILSVGSEYSLSPLMDGLFLIRKDYRPVGVADKYGNIYYAKK